MIDLLARYGIKEVADVVFYEKDTKGAPSAPVLYLDTLKVSTIEQSAETTDATGGKGNPPLISWDYGKEITVTLEDALFSARSLAMMFGGQIDVNATRQEVLKTVSGDLVKPAAINVASSGDAVYAYALVVNINGTDLYFPSGKMLGFNYEGSQVGAGVPLRSSPGAAAGSAIITNVPQDEADPVEVTPDFVTFDILDGTTVRPTSTSWSVTGNTATGIEIEISAEKFPGTYYITGDTYARNQASGKDEFFQFVIPNAKVQSTDLSLTMEAEGDPSTFSMTLKVLRTDDGQMMKLIKYGFDTQAANVDNKGVGSLVNSDFSGLTFTQKAITNKATTSDVASKMTDDNTSYDA